MDKRELELLEGVPVEVIDRYSDDQIQTLLKRLPRTKYSAAEEVAAKLVEYKDAKRNLDKVKAQQHMRARGKNELTSDGDRKAWAATQPETQEAESMLITAEAEYKMAEMRYEAYDDLFNAVRKLANIRLAQNTAVEQAAQTEPADFYETLTEPRE